MLPKAHKIFLISLICICSQLISSQQDNGIPVFDRKLCADSFACLSTVDGALQFTPIIQQTSNFVLAMQPYTLHKWLVIFQSNRTDNPIMKFTLAKSTGEDLFGCKVDNNAVVPITGTVSPNMHNGNSTSDQLYCEFIIDGKENEILPEDTENTLDVVLSFGDSNDLTIDYSGFRSAIKGRVFCDPSLILYQPSHSQSEIIEPVYSKSRNISCLDSKKQSLVYIDDSEVSHYGAKIICNTKIKNKPVYEVLINNNSTKMDNPFYAHCAVRACAQCHEVTPLPSCKKCKAPKFTNSTSPSVCAKLECDGDRFLIDNEAMPITSKPVCIPTGNGYKWSIDNRQFSHASCSKEVQCSKINPLVAVNCTDCEDIDVSQDTISCTDGYSLRASGDKKKWTDVDSVNCNFGTGEWVATVSGGMGSVPFKSFVQCRRTSKEGSSALSASSPSPNSAAFLSSEITITGLGIGAAVMLVIGVIIFLLYVFICRRKEKSQPMINEGKSIMPKTEKSAKSIEMDKTQSGMRAAAKKDERRMMNSQDASSVSKLESERNTDYSSSDLTSTDHDTRLREDSKGVFHRKKTIKTVIKHPSYIPENIMDQKPKDLTIDKTQQLSVIDPPLIETTARSDMSVAEVDNTQRSVNEKK